MTNSGPHCYGEDDLNLQPTGDDGSLATPKTEPDPPVEELTVNQVIQELIGRCYPTQAPISLGDLYQPREEPDTQVDLDITDQIGWICDFFPDLGICEQIFPKININVFDPRTSNWPYIDVTGDCAEVARIRDANRATSLGGGRWLDTESGKEYFCQQHDPNNAWEKCVKDTLECIFKPYATGTYKPPQGDCESFQPRGWSGNKKTVCVKNCYPERIPVWECVSGNDVGVPQLKPFSNENHNHRIITTNPDGSWNGKKVRNEGGNKYFNSGSTRSVSFNGFTVNVTPINDGGEWDSEWWISSAPSNPTIGQTYSGSFAGGKRTVEVEIEVVRGGSGTDHAYITAGVGETPTPPAGYTLTSNSPSFWILKEQARGSVPLFQFYSSTSVDSMLTINPGEPDSPGAGERSTMNAAGMANGKVLGYAFADAKDGIPYIGDKESLAPLHRYYQGYGNVQDHDHRVDINVDGVSLQAVRRGNKQLYEIPGNLKVPMMIHYDVHKGAAGYQNSWGVYISDPDGNPVWGRVILADATNSVGFGEYKVPLSILRQYAGGNVGFFLVPDGNRNGASNGQSVTFSDTGNGWRSSLNSAESNYTLFSDHRINYNKKDFTRWEGDNYQWWEDLLNGDDDYDDCKMFYWVQYGISTYLYEGIAAYVFRDNAPPRVEIPIQTRTPCDGRVLREPFREVHLIRSDCGSVTKSEQRADYECGPCTGSYMVELNKTQNVSVVDAMVGYQLQAFGSMISSSESECMQFGVVLKRNGSTIYSEDFIMKYWPEIGTVLTTFDAAPGDTLTFEITDITNANLVSNNQVKFGLFDPVDLKYDSIWPVSLGSTSDMDPGMTNINTGYTNGGVVHGLRMDCQYTQRKDDDRVWSVWSGRNGTPGIGNSDTRGYKSPLVWENAAPRASIEVTTRGPESGSRGRDSLYAMFYADDRILTRGDIRAGGMWIMEPDYDDPSHDDTWYYGNEDNIGFGSKGAKMVFGFGQFLVSDGQYGPHRGTAQEKRLSFPSWPVSRVECLPMPFFGEYRYFDRGLFGWWADHPDLVSAEDGIDPGQSAGSASVSQLYSAVEQAGMLQSEQTFFGNYTNWHPDAWFQDYYLRDERHPIGDAKVRVMFIPVPLNDAKSSREFVAQESGAYASGEVTTENGNVSSKAFRDRQQTKMAVWVEVVEILDAGSGYRTGDSFTFHYPPKRDKDTENPANTPYYPDQEANFNLPQQWKYHSRVEGPIDIKRNKSYYADDYARRVDRITIPKRTPYEAIYQESHNKNSKVWYWCSNKDEHRIKFRIRVGQTNPETGSASDVAEIPNDFNGFY